MSAEIMVIGTSGNWRRRVTIPSAPRASGKQGTRYPTTQRDLLERLRAAGFEVTTSGPTHGKITHPEHPGRFLPFASTPSTSRHGRHMVTAVRRVFGIDLRDRP